MNLLAGVTVIINTSYDVYLLGPLFNAHHANKDTMRASSLISAVRTSLCA